MNALGVSSAPKTNRKKQREKKNQPSNRTKRGEKTRSGPPSRTRSLPKWKINFFFFKKKELHHPQQPLSAKVVRSVHTSRPRDLTVGELPILVAYLFGG